MLAPVPDDAPAQPPLPVPAHDGLVFLRVPADARYARVVRIAVSAFAVRLHLPATAVEDLRLAADEALVLLLGSATDEPTGDTPDDANVVVSLEARDDELPVLLRLQLDPVPASPADDPAALARFRELVPPAMVVDRVDRDAGRIELRLPA
jgi:hypothetical protein